MIAISEDVRESISSLDRREKGFSRQVKYAALALGVLAAGALGASLLASFLGPSADLSNIDVPTKVRELFSTDGRFANISVPQMLSITTVLGFVLIGLGLIGFLLAPEQSPGPGPLVMLGILTLLMRFLFFPFIFNVAKIEEQTSSRDRFIQLVRDHEFEKVKRLLKEFADEPEGVYVLAQISIIEGENHMPITDEIVNKILLPSDDFTPKDKVLYVIERVAYGEPRSELAKAYRESAESRQKKAQWSAIFLGSMSAAAAGLIVALSFLRYSITSRIRRIWNLLGTTPDKDEKLQAAK